MVQVSSKNISQSLGLKIAEAKSLDSNYSINGLEKMGDKEDPMATPHVFS